MRIKNIIVGIFFGFLIILGMSVYKDYGIPWDESIQRSYGSDVYNYVVEGNQRLLKNKDRYYGPVVEFSHVLLEKTLDVTDIQKVYELRRLLNFIIFLVGAFFFYLLLSQRFRSIWWGLLGTTMLVLSPRIFAHSFYNSKDIGFMSLFIIASYLGLRFVKYRSTFLLVVASLAAGLLIDVRILGILVPVMLIDVYYLNDSKVKEKRKLWAYLIFTGLFTVIFWPTLWTSPLDNFRAAFEQMRNYPQKTSIMYFGDRVSSLAVPWHYVLGWIGVTTPILYLVAAITGIWKFISKVPKINRTDLYVLGWLFIPLVTVIVLKSTLYDAWRQMFFIYPAILYFAIFGLVKVSRKFRLALFFALALNIYFVICFMIKNHPNHQMYFNEFVSSPYNDQFELDYWGLSYKQGLEYIARTDSRNLIKIAVENLPGETNINMFTKEDRGRFEVVPRGSEDYYLTNYRKSKKLYNEPADFYAEVGGTRIMGVHKVKN